MRTRPLCMVCLLFLIIQSLWLVYKSGDSLYEVPASSIFAEGEPTTVSVRGQVYHKSYTSNNQILYLRNNSVQDSKLLVYDKNFTDIPIGKTITIKGRTSCFSRARNPGNFDQALYYAKQDIYGAIWCDEICNVTGERDILMDTLYQIKMKWKQKLVRIMGDENGSVLSAMLLGEKNEMDEYVKELYQKNGISHVLAISGLHISFIGMGIYHLLRKGGMPYMIAGIMSVLALSGYVLMLGFSVSIMRAYIMLLLRIGADMSGRVYDMPTALALSATLTVLKQPLYLTDGGFWMSYGAIAGILYVLPALQKFFLTRNRQKAKHITFFRKQIHKLVDGAMVSVAVNIALFPIMLWFYYEFSVYSTLLNIIVVPLMSVLLGFGMAGSFLLMSVEPIGIFLLKVCDLILQFFETITLVGSRLPFASIVLGKPNIWEIFIYYVILLFIIVFGRKCKKKHICMLFLGSLLLFVYRPNGNLQVTMLDVGQGDGIFIKGPTGMTCLIDGGSSDVEELGKYRLEPYLKSQGVGTLDYVFVTHGDADHYSGIEEMIDRQAFGVVISNLVLPGNFKYDDELNMLAKKATQNGIRVLVIDEGESISGGNLYIKCVQPGKSDTKLQGNAGSMVLEIYCGAFSMLCTGDVEGDGEEILTKHLQKKTYHVLKVAHHGSKNSTTEEFLKTIQAEIALISAGVGNSYGHPHKETTERLQKAGYQIYETPKTGAITLIVKGNSLTISLLPYRL